MNLKQSLISRLKSAAAQGWDFKLSHGELLTVLDLMDTRTWWQRLWRRKPEPVKSCELCGSTPALEHVTRHGSILLCGLHLRDVIGARQE